jgi:Tfp pilus assembly protein PilF/CheY-like chemotaxis protein
MLVMSHVVEKVAPDVPILIAEANFTDLSELKRNFEQLFLKNLSVTGRGFRAVELSRRIKFEVIFVANPLVNLDGLQVIQAMREEGKNTSTPIVFLSEQSGESIIEMASEFGASSTICKPITQEALRGVLEDILDTQIITKSEERDRVQDSMQEAQKAVNFARKLRSDGDYELAQDAFRTALVEVFCGLAEVYLSKGDKNAADEILREAEKIDPRARKNFEIREEHFIEQGKIWLQKKQYIGARAEFQAALTLNEINASALLGLGEALYGLNELDEAKKVFERIMAAKGVPNDPVMFKQIGMTACRGKHFDLAHKALDRAAKIFPSDSKVFYCKAVAFVAAGDYESSMPYLDKSLRLEPGFAEARALDVKVKTWLTGMEGEQKTLSEMDIH